MSVKKLLSTQYQSKRFALEYFKRIISQNQHVKNCNIHSTISIHSHKRYYTKQQTSILWIWTMTEDELSKSIPRTPSFCREEGVVASIHLQEKAWKPKMHSIAVTILTIHLDNWKSSLGLSKISFLTTQTCTYMNLVLKNYQKPPSIFQDI